MASVQGFTLNRINRDLIDGWEARIIPYQENRIYYVSHHTQTTQWAPPQESWKSSETSLPYGWEEAVDNEGKNYFINHAEKQTTRDEPGGDVDLEPPLPRQVELIRDAQMGFGFVAGSEKPVIVRFVTEGGPSENKLQPGDQILQINEEDVKTAAREHVIELVRSCQKSITLTVCQPHIDNSQRKSAILTAAKKARLKNTPFRVRFAEAVVVNGAPVVTPSNNESYIPFMPNVLKVFLENGQTKSFKYDNKTTVKDVLDSLQEKLNITCIEHFALVLQNMKSPTQNKMNLLHEPESLAEIAARPGSQHFKCLFRVTFVPKDAYDLLRADEPAFEYFYMQCCNDVVQERFASELKYDMALRLAALHIQQHAISSNMASKLSIKAIEKECGLERFVPQSLLGSMKGKDLRKTLTHYLKSNQNLTTPGQKQLTAVQAQMHYLKVVGELRSFGGKSFVATFEEKYTEAMISVGPKYGVAIVTNIKTNALATLGEFSQIKSITVTKDSENMQRVELQIENADEPQVTLSMLTDDVGDFVGLVEGYYRIFVDKDGVLMKMDENKNNNTEPEVPQYHGKHTVPAAPWTYPADEGLKADESSTAAGTREKREEEEDEANGNEHVVDLSLGPPPYNDSLQYIEQVAKQQAELEAEKLEKKAVDKPNELKVVPISTVAPLASPDVSTISGSSESSSITQPESSSSLEGADISDEKSHSLTSQLGDGEGFSDNSASVDDLMRDSDSLTNSSIATVISTGSNGGNTSPPRDMNRPRGPVQDSRFGVRTFRTFSASPPVTRRNLPESPGFKLSNGNVPGGESPSPTTHAGDYTTDDQEASPRGSRGDAPITGRSFLRPVVQKEIPLSAGEALIEDYAPSESDDTDSISTPTDSPAHARLDSIDLKPPSLKDSDRPHSFGLHSPDQIPATETDFAAIACSFGLRSPDNGQSDSLHPSYNPRLFSDGDLYLDPDIIDLTLIPPPKTPDSPDKLMDFANMTEPPPGFDDPGAAADSGADDFLPPGIMDKIDSMVLNDEELGTQLAAIDALLLADQPLVPAPDDLLEKESGIESESDSGNETISSENVDILTSTLQDFTMSPPRGADALRSLAACGMSPVVPGGGDVTFDTDDIEAFIASVSVPPPPDKSDGDSEEEEIRSVPPPGSPPRGGPGSGDSTPHYATPPDLVAAPIPEDSTLLVNTEYASDEFDLPPPPEQDEELHGQHHTDRYSEDLPPIPPSMDQLNTFSGEESWEHLLVKPPEMQTSLLDDDFAQFVIPPPPDDTEKRLSLGDIPMVPAVCDSKTPSPEDAVFDSPPEPVIAESSGTNDSPPPAEGSPVLRQKIDSGASIRERIQELKGSFGAKDKDRPLNLARPKEPPPAPPSAYSRSISEPQGAEPQGEGKKKLPPPTPRRQSSYDSSSGSAVTSPSEEVHKLSMELNLASPQWNEESRSADSSPLHRIAEIYAHSRVHNSMGTLPRLRPGLRGPRTAPPPPPRRSSMPGTSLTDQGSGSSEGSTTSLDAMGRPNFDKYKLPVMRRDYENVYSPQRSNGEPALARKAHSMVIPKSAFLAEEAVPEEAEAPKSVAAPQKTQQQLDAEALVSASLPELQTVEALRLHHEQLVADSSSLFDPVKPESKFNSFKSKLKAYVSPSVHRKQYTTPKSINGGKGNKSSSGKTDKLAGDNLGPRKSDYLSSSPTNVGRSNTFNTTSTIPRPYGSPRNSPGLQRHSSFTEREKVAERTPSTFKTFLGDKAAVNRTVSNASSSSGSAPTSPRKGSPRLGQSVGLNRASSGSSSNSNGSEVSASSPRTTRSAPGTPKRSDSNSSSSVKSGTETGLQASLLRARADLKSIESPELKKKEFRVTKQSGQNSCPSSPGSVKKSVPLKVVHPLVPTQSASLDSATHTASIKRTDSGRSGDKVHSLARSLEDQFTAHAVQADGGNKDSSARLPPWRSRNNPLARTSSTASSSSSEGKNGSSSSNSRVTDSRSSQSPRYNSPSRIPILPNSNGSGTGGSGSPKSQRAASSSGGGGGGRRGSASSSNKDESPMERITRHTYTTDRAFLEANRDVDNLLGVIDRTMGKVADHESTPNSNVLRSSKETLTGDARQFVTDSKLLVSSATHSREKLVQNVNNSMHTLARIITYCQITMEVMSSPQLAVTLGMKVKDVCNAYTETVNAAGAAAGKPLSDPNMKHLMKQATTLASILSVLMKTLKALDTS